MPKTSLKTLLTTPVSPPLRVHMLPTSAEGNGGITRVLEAYFKYLPEFGIEFVTDSEDLVVTHAGTHLDPDILHCHGLYWTAEPNYRATIREFEDNAFLIEGIRNAHTVIVPSKWVARAFERDMHFSPEIIPHGIDPDLFDLPVEPHLQANSFVLWNKSRIGDACDPTEFLWLAEQFPEIPFKSTLAFEDTHLENLEVTGLLPYPEMLKLVSQAKVYTSLARETFGIGVMEALALGVPVLAWDFGNHRALVQHGLTGYLARPGDLEDLANGLLFILDNHAALSTAARAFAKTLPTWREVCEKLAKIYHKVHADKHRSKKVGVVIPFYNKPQLEQALISLENQTRKVDELVIVNDGSHEDFTRNLAELSKRYHAHLIHQTNKGVAHARNAGLDLLVILGMDYLACLDADDTVHPKFIETTMDALNTRPGLSIAYTKLLTVEREGSSISQWPGEFNYDEQVLLHNQIPTCCLFRAKVYTRLGGYRQRYAPRGAGEEDAEFWLRAGARGLNARLVSEEPLFQYAYRTGQVSGNPDHKPTAWGDMHPWTRDGLHPFASLASTPRKSHLANSYDSPLITIVIPCSKKHVPHLYDALDSLESQTLRNWEVVVVFDFEYGIDPLLDLSVNRFLQAYPFVTHAYSHEKGAGAARNLGVKLSRTEYLFFLDADDLLIPKSLETFYTHVQREPKQIVYSEDYGISTIPREKLSQIDGQVVEYIEAKSRAIIHYRPGGYDCAKAQRQPELDHKGVPYVWANVSSMLSRVTFEKVGGFDEMLPSWEDIDFHWRAAKMGICYTYVQEPLLTYRYETGTRREFGLANAPELLSRLREKYKSLSITMCGCNSSSPVSTPSPFASDYAQRMSPEAQSFATPVTPIPGQTYLYKTRSGQDLYVQASELITVRYTSRNQGSHSVIGRATGIDYFQHAGGEMFTIHRKDFQISGDIFVPVTNPSPI